MPAYRKKTAEQGATDRGSDSELLRPLLPWFNPSLALAPSVLVRPCPETVGQPAVTRLLLANLAGDRAVALVVHDRLRHAGSPAAAPSPDEEVPPRPARLRHRDVPADWTEVVGSKRVLAAANHDHVVRYAAVEEKRPLYLPKTMARSVPEQNGYSKLCSERIDDPCGARASTSLML